MSTFNDRVASIRRLIHDVAAPQRYSDTEILERVNEAMKLVAKVRGEFFHKTDLYDCVDEDPFQQLDPLESFGLVDVIASESGSAITRVERTSLQNIAPRWIVEEPGVPVHWMPASISDPLSFYLYPPPLPGQRIYVLHVSVPELYALEDAFPLPGYFEAAVDDYVASRFALIDDGEVELDRSDRVMKLFLARISGGSSENIVTERRE